MQFESPAQQLLETLTTAVILIDAGMCVSYLNSAAEVLLEVSGPRSLGEPINKLIVETDASDSGLERAAATGSGFTKRQTCVTLASGRQTMVDYIVTPYGDDPKRGFVIEIQPLDRLLQISREEAMVSSQQMTHTMIQGLAHEIKNPLGGLRGAAQLLAKELPSEHLVDYTNIIIEEADRLGRLVDRMLGAPRQLQCEATNVHEIMERVRQLVSAEVGPEIAIERDYDPSIPSFPSDRELLIQGTLNVVRNSAQALSSTQCETRQGKIVLRTRTQRQFTIGNARHRLVCRIDVADNGPGIPKEIADTLFLPMVSGRAEGTGLGLAIAQSIFTQHKGLITCTSEAGNTVFSMYLPIEAAQ